MSRNDTPPISEIILSKKLHLKIISVLRIFFLQTYIAEIKERKFFNDEYHDLFFDDFNIIYN